MLNHDETQEERAKRFENKRERKRVADKVEKEKTEKSKRNEFNLLRAEFKMQLNQEDILNQTLSANQSDADARTEARKVINKIFAYRESVITLFITKLFLLKLKMLVAKCKADEVLVKNILLCLDHRCIHPIRKPTLLKHHIML